MPYSRRTTYRRRRPVGVRRFKRTLYKSKRSPLRSHRKSYPSPNKSVFVDSLFPRHKDLVFRYNTIGVPIVCTGGVATSLSYNINAPNDLDGAGAQPRYWDTLMGADGGAAPYSKYIVKGCKVLVTLTSSTSTAVCLVLGMYNSDSTAATTASEAGERQDYRIKTMGSNAGGPSVLKLGMYRSMRQIFDRKILDDPDVFGAEYNAQPTKLATGHIMASPIVSGSTVTYYVNIYIKVYCRVYSKNDVADS